MTTPDTAGLTPAPQPDPDSSESHIGLAPIDAFPEQLIDLSLIEVHVLHSRICHQLHHEHLADPAGPHPITRDRHGEVTAELGARDALRPRPGKPTSVHSH